MKLQPFSDQQYLIISQTGHGAAQGGMAFDFAHLKGNAPADGVITNVHKVYNPSLDPKYPYRQSWFDYGKDGWLLRMVHAMALQIAGTVTKLGESLWKSYWHHIHIALQLLNKWYHVLDFVDRKVELFWLKYGQKHPIWTNWGTYTDRELPPYFEETMVKAVSTNLHQITSTNTAGLRIRLEPNTDAKILGEIPGNYSWQSNIYAEGQVVDGENKWWQIITPSGTFTGVVGYVSAKWLKAEPVGSDPELQKQLDEEKAKNVELTTENGTLKATNEQYKPGYDAAKLIQSTQ